jgi:hypothetical protein
MLDTTVRHLKKNDMEWKIYRLTYKAESPIRIGTLSLGYVLRTRHYLTGRAMWGSASAKLTRVYQGMDYMEVGEFFKDSAIFSYFYPMVYEPAEKIYLPRFTDKGIFYADLPIEDFERSFVSSIGLTALVPESLTAEQGALHETEFLLPTNLDGIPVFFIGYLFLKKGRGAKDRGNGGKEKLIDWDKGEICLKGVLESLQVGGERKYGFGKITLYKSEEVKLEDKKMKLFNIEINPQKNTGGGQLLFEIPDSQPLFAHLLVEGTAPVKLKGDIEPLVGREWGEVIRSDGEKAIGAGQKITEARICWVPGSVLEEEKVLRIGRYGILE